MTMNWLEGMPRGMEQGGRPMAMPVFAGQKLVVVGGSSGMGRQTAADVVAAGGSAVIIGVGQDKVDETVKALATDGTAWGITADLSDRMRHGRPELSTTHMTTYRMAEVDGIAIFHREAGPADTPATLLLHGFPSPSPMREPLLSRPGDALHLAAPDYPGFGHSDTPDPAAFPYTFDHLAEVIDRSGTCAYIRVRAPDGPRPDGTPRSSTTRTPSATYSATARHQDWGKYDHPDRR